MAITATTRLAAVIGSPVRHSLSPVIHNAGFEACGVDAVYLAMHVDEGHAPDAVQAMRRFEWLGCSVTMPHKHAVLECCDTATPTAAALNAANCLYWDDRTLVADNTDGAGFIRGLRADLDLDPAGMVCAIAGAGGAARAVAKALADADAARVIIVNRTPSKAQAAVAVAGAVGAAGTAADLAGADLVVNATPVGMNSTSGADALPFDISLLADDAVVSDLIYHPSETALIAQARARGLVAQNGLSMLLFQAVEAFERWTGLSAPVDEMAHALTNALSSPR